MKTKLLLLLLLLPVTNNRGHSKGPCWSVSTDMNTSLCDRLCSLPTLSAHISPLCSRRMGLMQSHGPDALTWA